MQQTKFEIFAGAQELGIPLACYMFEFMLQRSNRGQVVDEEEETFKGQILRTESSRNLDINLLDSRTNRQPNKHEESQKQEKKSTVSDKKENGLTASAADSAQASFGVGRESLHSEGREGRGARDRKLEGRIGR